MTPPAALPHATPLRHPRLPRETVWETVGDPTLLDAATFVPVILSRRLKGEALETELAWILAAAQTGAVAIGGFVSPGERIAAQRLAALPALRLIRLVPYPLALYRPTSEGLRRIREGKTLLLSGIPEGDGRLRRDDCVRNNRWALAIAAGREAFDPAEGPHANPSVSRGEIRSLSTRDAPYPAEPPPEGPDPAAIFL